MNHLNEKRRLDLGQPYQKFVCIWLGIISCHLCFVLIIYLQVSDVFPIDVTKPIIPVTNGEFWLVAVTVLLSGISLFESFFYRSRLMSRAIEQKSIEVMQYAFIRSLSMATGISLWGVFLAFTIHYQYFFIFSVVGFVTTLLQYPQKSDVEEATSERLPT